MENEQVLTISNAQTEPTGKTLDNLSVPRLDRDGNVAHRSTEVGIGLGRLFLPCHVLWLRGLLQTVLTSLTYRRGRQARQSSRKINRIFQTNVSRRAGK